MLGATGDNEEEIVRRGWSDSARATEQPRETDVAG